MYDFPIVSQLDDYREEENDQTKDANGMMMLRRRSMVMRIIFNCL